MYLSNSLGLHMRVTFLITFTKSAIRTLNLASSAMAIGKIFRGHRFGIMEVEDLDVIVLGFRV